ncbi:MAG: protease modulator HflC [Candidatus Dasytiphilus stammeri]
MRKSILIIIFFTILFILLYSSFFVIQEGQRGILLRFGKIVRNINNNSGILLPGLHLKNPLIEKEKIFDVRIQTMENKNEKFITQEKKDIFVDSYIKWRITDLNRFYVSTGGHIEKIENFLRKTFSDRLRSEIGRLNVKDIVTDSRKIVTSILRQQLNESIIDIRHNLLGIQIIDVRINKINLPSEVLDAIYKRMRVEQKADANFHSSQGKEKAEKIRALADYKVIAIIAQAKKQAYIIHGDTDLLVNKLFTTYFNNDINFYSFIRTLHAYKNIFHSHNTFIILDIHHPFLRYMMSSFYNPNNINQIKK